MVVPLAGGESGNDDYQRACGRRETSRQGTDSFGSLPVRNAPDAKKKRSLMELRTILDWDVARPLLGVPGVIEVNTFGGELKTYEVRLDPERLLARNISVTRVLEALRRNNSNAGGGYIERSGQVRVIRAKGLVGSLKDIEEIVLDTTANGTPIYVRDVGTVLFAPMIRQGVVTR